MKELQHLDQERETRAPFWSQPRKGSSLVIIWWLGLDPWGSARHSLKELDGATALWAHTPQGQALGSDAL